MVIDTRRAAVEHQLRVYLLKDKLVAIHAVIGYR